MGAGIGSSGGHPGGNSKRTQSDPGKLKSQANIIAIIIILSSAVMAFTAESGKFNPVVLLLGILVAAVIYWITLYGIRRPRCAACGGDMPKGARFCPLCGGPQQP